MKRRRFDRPPGNGFEERVQQQQELKGRRDALLEKMRTVANQRAARQKDVETKTKTSRSHRNVEFYLQALADIPFYRLGSRTRVYVAPWYQTIIRSALETMNDGGARVVMTWPLSQTCPSGILDLIALGATASAQPTQIVVAGQHEDAREQADGLRALLYPYARSTHAAARQVQVDRTEFGSIHFDHVKRCLDGPAAPGTKDYHQVLSRVRQLTGQAIDGQSYAEFEHPILDELVPHGPPDGQHPANSELLWRTRHKTDIGQLSRTGAADDPASATYYIYTVRANDAVSRQLAAIAESPHLFVVDLSRTARGRLGWNWQARAKKVVDEVRKRHPDTAILALTDDPWAYRVARFEVLGSRTSGKKGKVLPAPGRVVFAPENDILTESKKPGPAFEGPADIEVDGFYGDLDRLIEDLRSLARALVDRGNPSEAATVRDLIATIRRSACLPGSLSAFSAFLEAETTAAMAADIFASYRIGANLTSLSDVRSLASQLDIGQKTATNARELMHALEAQTPMALLLQDAMQALLRSSSRSLVVFRSDMIAEFATNELTKRIPKLNDRLDSDMVRLGGSELIATVSAAQVSFRNQFKRVILVAPTSSSILATFAEPWLPDHVVILADADTLAFAAKDAERLASELNDGLVAERLRQFATHGLARISEIGRHAVRLDDELPSEDIEFPTGTVIDLSGGGRSDRDLIEIRMNNGQRILSHRSTGIVVRHDGATTLAFIEKPASAIKVGEEVCVIGPSFIERARSLLNVRGTAAAEIREYHNQVASRFAALPGHSIVDRLRHVVAEMGEPRVSLDTARYWISLEQELEKELHEVVPHAPQDRDTFLRFTAALGIGPKLAENFWRWAVVAQRSHRLRSGNVFHDAFRGILTDPHAALAENVDRIDEIRTLRFMAESHVATVAEIEWVGAI